MKKTKVAFFIVLCLLFMSLTSNYKASLRANSTRTLIVGNEPDDFKTIQDAINNASSGDIIFVRNGTYIENIVITKSITLIGENSDFTIINGNNTGHVVVIEANNVNIQGFTIKMSGSVPYSGIFVKPPSASNAIINNKIVENSYGIYLYFSSNNIVSRNLFSNNIYGISLTSCSNNIVSDNIVLSSVNDGICLFNSFNNTITNNFIAANELTGISLYNSEANIVFGNNISYNRFYGISLYSSSVNVFSTNTIVNHPYGINFAFSSNNTVYHNNFNNTVQVSSDNSKNFWSFYGEGNYWSDYYGRDLNGDGIGDTPYVIDENNVDIGPLMGRFFAFNIIYKKETYQVTIISNSSISDFQFQLGVETGNKIIRFKPIGNENFSGFCRVMVPIKFLGYPYIVLLGNEEVSPTFLDVSNETNVYLYFSYLHTNQTITIISSELYEELFTLYIHLNATYYNFLDTFYDLLNNYTSLLDNFARLQSNFEQLNASSQHLYELNATFYNFLNNYSRLQEDFHHLNETYYNLKNTYLELERDYDNLTDKFNELLDNLVLLLGNYTQLQEEFQSLEASYQEYLYNYSQNVSNVRNLSYVLAAMAATLIIVTAYLSKRAHRSLTTKLGRIKDENKRE
ncbi:MAG: NosD domain-containing protein [Candidatus Bathyarchaeia archaeon]